jgi:hypothetical protein
LLNEDLPEDDESDIDYTLPLGVAANITSLGKDESEPAHKDETELSAEPEAGDIVQPEQADNSEAEAKDVSEDDISAEELDELLKDAEPLLMEIMKSAGDLAVKGLPIEKVGSVGGDNQTIEA